MSSKARPRALTILAICNFIFAAMFVIGLINYLGRMRYVSIVEDSSPALTQQLSQSEQRQGLAIVQLGVTPYYMLGMVIVVMAALLVVSGIGYLRLKRFEGRTLGNIAVLLSIGTGLAVAFWLPQVLDGGLNGFSTINLTYPLLTLFLLNKTFKDRFVN